MVKILDSLVVCRYKLILSKDVTGRYSIVYERLSTKKATSRSDNTVSYTHLRAHET